MTKARVALGIPWFRSGCAYRERNYNFIQTYVPTLYPFDKIFVAGGPKLNRGSARNELVYQAALHSVDVIVLCDADSFPNPDGLRDAIDACYDTGGIHFPFGAKDYRGLSDASSVQLLSSENPTELAPSLAAEVETIGSFGGCFAVRPDDWFGAGGSPQFPHWGFEDIITVVCYRTMLDQQTVWRTDGIPLYHLWHPKATDDYSTGDFRMMQNAICQEFEAAQFDKVKVRDLLVKYREYYQF